MAMYVFRMQNKEGRGPYHQMFTGPDGDWISYRSAWAIRAHEHPERPGLMFDDGLMHSIRRMTTFREREWRFGFKSKEQALEWFDSTTERARLAEHGFRVVRIRAERIIYGDKQVLFQPEGSYDGTKNRQLQVRKTELHF